MTATTEIDFLPPGPSWVMRIRAHARGYLGNPLLVRDMRAFLRGRRPIALQLGYLALTTAAMLIGALVCHEERTSYATYGYGGLPSYGKCMFIAVFETQFALLALITLAYCAGAVTMEHEKRTFEMLSVTTLSSLEIVAGKVMAVVSLCLLLLSTSLPLAAICIALGGVSPGEVLLAYGLLASALPLWAASCVLISTLVPRTISAYVTCMLWLGVLMALTTYLSIPHDPSALCIGILNPAVAFAADEYVDFGFFGKHLPAWITPLVLDGLATVLCLVAAAEVLPQHRPRRSTVLRWLSLSLYFLFGSLLWMALLAQNHPGGSGQIASDVWSDLAAGLGISWLAALLVLALTSSYPPPAEAYARPVAWLLGSVSWRRWFERTADVGWRTALIFFCAGELTIVLAFLLAAWAGALAPVTWGDLPATLFAFVLYTLSIGAYACWAGAFSFHLESRRISLAVTILLLLAVNALAACYMSDPDMFRRLPPLAHPAVLNISPVPAAAAALGHIPGRLWPDAWSDPWFVIVLPLLYQVAFGLAGLAYLRRVARTGHAQSAMAAERAAPSGGLTEEDAMRDTGTYVR